MNPIHTIDFNGSTNWSTTCTGTGEYASFIKAVIHLVFLYIYNSILYSVRYICIKRSVNSVKQKK